MAIMYHGVEGVASEDDFLIESSDIPEIEKVDNKIFEYSQAKNYQTLNSCTIFGSTGAISDLLNYKYDYDELLAIDKESYKLDRMIGRGRRVYKAIDLVRDERNKKNPNNKLLSFRTSVDDDTMVDALNKGHSLVTSYKGNAKYNQDYKANGKLNKASFGNSTYGHCIRIRKIDGLVYVIDNYSPRKYNKYELADFRELVKNGVFSKFQYLFLPEKKLEKSKEELILISNLKKIKKINSAMWKLADEVVGYEEVKTKLHELNIEIEKHTK